MDPGEEKKKAFLFMREVRPLLELESVPGTENVVNAETLAVMKRSLTCPTNRFGSILPNHTASMPISILRCSCVNRWVYSLKSLALQFARYRLSLLKIPLLDK